ncbi:uncharacterized protein BXZ73DRAFT_99388 [Epithele typhae]|uniref:uncharacterized protein n=1 Tax=Epithele typhae TaxID=378194 RepID=UPI00200741E3|nr:uncharacterized protein BXZ73DRAFT_99388 [Epithele typhae]KAH9939756.1 hypothetical protein BXZ73DRAFT_99388 [Epithele typhae]
MSSTAIPPLDNTYGSVLIGTCLGLILYGVTLLQSYRYFQLFPADRPFLKMLVVAMLILETLYTVLSMHICYWSLVTNYANPQALFTGRSVWSLAFLPLASGLLMMTSQIFFLRRIIIVGRKYWPCAGVAIMLIITQVSFESLATQRAFTLDVSNVHEIFGPSSTGAVFALAADLIITGTLILSLWQSKTGFSQTNTLLNKLILYSVNTGLIAGAINVISVILAFRFQQTLLTFAPGIICVRFYAVSMMAALNTRASLKGRGRSTNGTSNGASGLEMNTPVNIKLQSRPQVQNIDVSVNVEEHSDMHKQPVQSDGVSDDFDETRKVQHGRFNAV